MTATTSRRAILAGMVSIAPASAIASVSPTNDYSEAEINRLWEERYSIILSLRENRKAHDVAHALLPSWAAEGPEYLQADGTRSGSVVGWPEVENPTLPQEGLYRKVRPSPYSIRGDFEQYVANFNGRERARATYRRRMRTLVARIRQQRAEESKVGLDEIGADGDLLRHDLYSINETIQNFIAPGRFNALAAHLLIETCHDGILDSAAEDSAVALAAMTTFKSIMPFLTGTIANDAAELVQNPTKPIGEFAWKAR